MFTDLEKFLIHQKRSKKAPAKFTKDFFKIRTGKLTVPKRYRKLQTPITVNEFAYILRLRAQLTQRALSERLFWFSHQAIHNWEKGSTSGRVAVVIYELRDYLNPDERQYLREIHKLNV